MPKDMMPIARVPLGEGERQLTDAELRSKLNELIDLANAQREEIAYLHGQVNLLIAQLVAVRQR
jgi:hypothetical protein